jgi:hypothetical protein
MTPRLAWVLGDLRASGELVAKGLVNSDGRRCVNRGGRPMWLLHRDARGARQCVRDLATPTWSAGS